MTDRTRYSHPCFPNFQMDELVVKLKHDPKWSWLIDAIIGANKRDQWQKWTCRVIEGEAILKVEGSLTSDEMYILRDAHFEEGQFTLEVRKLKGKMEIKKY